MREFIDSLFSPSGLTPHGFCLLWQPDLIWLHAAADAMTALAYFSIPGVLVAFVRRRPDVAFSWIFWLSAAFILACGTTHVLAVITLWEPYYALEGSVKLITAILSLATAAALWRFLPQAVSLPTRSMLLQARTQIAEHAQALHLTASRLQDSENRASALISTPAKLFTLDQQGDIIAVSDRCLEALNESLEDALGTPFSRYIAPENQARFNAGWHDVLAGTEMRNVEHHLASWARSPGLVEISMLAERGPDGTILRVLGAMTDISARRRAEEELHAAQDRLERAERLEAIGQLTGGIAHDFNNLLAVVVTNLDMLADEQPSPAEAHAMVAQALAAALHGAALTRQLLAFARRLPLEPRVVDLNALTSGMVSLLGRTLGANIAVSLGAAPNLWPVTADPSQLENAVLNLAINARDAMPDGGTLRLETAMVTLGAADIAGVADAMTGEHVVLTLSDTGTGMTDEVLARVFEPFFTTKPEGRGNGLGLSMVYGFTRQSGGHVRIVSTLGKGTSVKLYLPRSIADFTPTPKSPAAPPSLPRGAETLLVVDDNAAVRQATCRILAKLGYHVLQADDGHSALALLDSELGIDLLFTDVVMPGGLNGPALVEKALELRADLAVLVTSGYAHMSGAEQAAGGGAILTKPYRREELALRVRAALDQRGRAAPNSP